MYNMMHCCRNGPLLTEWALMEAAEGNVEEARGIFARGAQGSPHAPLLIAWAELEQDNNRHAHLLGCPTLSQNFITQQNTDLMQLW